MTSGRNRCTKRALPGARGRQRRSYGSRARPRSRGRTRALGAPSRAGRRCRRRCLPRRSSRRSSAVDPASSGPRWPRTPPCTSGRRRSRRGEGAARARPHLDRSSRSQRPRGAMRSAPRRIPPAICSRPSTQRGARRRQARSFPPHRSVRAPMRRCKPRPTGIIPGWRCTRPGWCFAASPAGSPARSS